MAPGNWASRWATSAGKGSAAALYGAVATGILRSLYHELQPAELLRQLNRRWFRSADGRYMTFCFATWQKNRRGFSTTNAGQSQPITLERRASRTAQPGRLPNQLQTPPMMSGASGSTLATFCSSIRTESTEAAWEGKFLGTGRLKELLAANANLDSASLADRLLKEVQQYTQGGPITDDRTLVVMKVK